MIIPVLLIPVKYCLNLSNTLRPTARRAEHRWPAKSFGGRPIYRLAVCGMIPKKHINSGAQCLRPNVHRAVPAGAGEHIWLKHYCSATTRPNSMSAARINGCQTGQQCYCSGATCTCPKVSCLYWNLVLAQFKCLHWDSTSPSADGRTQARMLKRPVNGNLRESRAAIPVHSHC